MFRRLEADKAKAVKVFPFGNAHAGHYDVTVLNLSESGSFELVNEEGDAVGDGFPLKAGAAWDSRIAGAEQVWAVTTDAAVVPFVVSATLAA